MSTLGALIDYLNKDTVMKGDGAYILLWELRILCYNNISRRVSDYWNGIRLTKILSASSPFATMIFLKVLQIFKSIASTRFVVCFVKVPKLESSSCRVRWQTFLYLWSRRNGTTKHKRRPSQLEGCKSSRNRRELLVHSPWTSLSWLESGIIKLRYGRINLYKTLNGMFSSIWRLRNRIAPTSHFIFSGFCFMCKHLNYLRRGQRKMIYIHVALILKDSQCFGDARLTSQFSQS